MNNTMGLDNVIGTQCICCKQFIPIQGQDCQGNTVTFEKNPINLCPECMDVLIKLIQERKEKDLKKPTYDF